MLAQRLKGTVTAVLNPVGLDNRYDPELVRRFCDFQIAKGVQGFFVNGSTGAFAVLGIDAQKAAIKAYVQAAGGRVPVVAHVGGTRRDEVLELATYAAGLGVDGIAAVPPFYYGYDKQALIAHFVDVGEAAPETPLYLYNFPAAARNDLNPQFLRELRDVCPQLAGVKDTTQDYCRYVDYLDVLGPDFCSLMGSDAMYLACLVMGGSGAISALASSFPEIMTGIEMSYHAGDLQRARKLQRLAARLRHVFGKPVGQSLRKQALAFRGIEFPAAHPPMRDLTSEEIEALRTTLRALEQEFSVSLLCAADNQKLFAQAGK